MSFYKAWPDRVCEQAQRGMSRFSWGIDFLDDALTGISETDLILLGAGTGVGKTQVATHIAKNAAMSGKHVYYFALEAEQDEIENRIVYSELAKHWWAKNPHGKPGVSIRYVSWLHGDHQAEFKPFEEAVTLGLRESLYNLETIYKADSFSVDDFIKYFDAVHDDAGLIVIDHLHYFDMDQRDELAALRDAIRKIRNAALRHKKPVLLIAHLRKADRQNKSPIPDIEDFYGSSDLIKIGVNVVMLSRAHTELKSGNSATWVYLAKARHAGDAAGYVGLVGYDLKTGTYAPRYRLFKNKRHGELEELPFEAIPRWAKRAAIPDKAREWMPAGSFERISGKEPK